MKLKLIRTAGFIGKPKIAEAELPEGSGDLKQHLQDLFADRAEPRFESSRVRDKESLILEFEGKMKPLNSLKLSSELEVVVQRMMGELEYRK